MTATLAALVISLGLAGQSAAAPRPLSADKPAYLYKLANFGGALPFSAARIFTDDSAGETYTISAEGITIFNRQGMEVQRFHYDPAVGVVYDAAVNEQGEVFLLVYRDGAWSIVRCNYRLEPRGELVVSELPADFAGFKPERMLLQDGQLYLVSMSLMRVVLATADGAFVRGWDLAALIGSDETGRVDTGLGGFAVDAAGSMYFTVPVTAQVYRLATDGTLAFFGKRGSAPGRFGVISDVAVDAAGNCLVADKLRCVVMIFDKDFRFVTEFGGRGRYAGRMVAPNQMALGLDGRLFVSLLGRQGVNVYQLNVQ
jgi:hypothetical protein